MEWITKPNKWYDKQEEPKRFSLMLIIIVPLLMMGFFGKVYELIGLFVFGLIGLYRLMFHIVMDSQKLTQADKKSVS